MVLSRFLRMLDFLDISQSAFLFLLFGVPALAIGLGIYSKSRLLIAALVCQFLVMIVYLAAVSYIIENGLYPAATGMEGIAFFVMPALYLASATVSTVFYFLAGWISRRLRGR